MSARVLVVDDLLPNVKLLEARLTAEYFNVVTASGGAEALAIAQADPPDILLLDVMMPGMDGFETCRRMKGDARTAHIPVVMVTALSDVQDRVRGLEAGADDFITKPVNDLALYARIRSLVRLKMAVDEWRLRQATGTQLGLVTASAQLDAKADHGAKILVVEDNATVAERIRQSLSGDGQNVEIMTDGAAVVPRAAQGDFDLLIVSLLLKGSDGLRLCAQLRSSETTRHVPILVLVDDGDYDRLAKGLDIGVNDYLMRPVDRNELLARCRTQIRRRRYQQRLRDTYEHNISLALTDSLTGLYNRRYFTTHLDGLFEQAAGAGKSLALLMIDIDNFKTINDTYGHAVGDEVLRGVANRLTEYMRSFDTIARWGGEEFAVVMPEADPQIARGVAERLRRKIAGRPFAVSAGVGEVNVTISLGLAVSAGDTACPDDLLRSADAALYQAKRDGRNRIVAANAAAAAALSPATATASQLA
ncbi:MAG: PleD family two-component system response regulator [Proteobacteria bacterium]|nr:PleD family two-component system response regulator [Pseudomonadota bacterium]